MTGAFIEIAVDYKDFTRAFLRKLTRKLTAVTAGNDLGPSVFAHQARLGALNAHRGE